MTRWGGIGLGGGGGGWVELGGVGMGVRGDDEDLFEILLLLSFDPKTLCFLVLLYYKMFFNWVYILVEWIYCFV